ncbi:STP22 (YCL008C) [Zygosaccharomyces parabailii]|nr:STP22 (YCL008C) [Zygosaccharomyces parabailii]
MGLTPTESSVSIPQPVINWLFGVIQPIYHDKRTTFHDSVEVLNHFKNLRPRTRVYTDSSGISELLLCIYGKPLASSSVPLLIWVPKSYPLEHPLVYIDLEALQDTKVSPGKHVDPNGSISIPLFDKWDSKTCNLLQAVDECIKICRYDHVVDPITPVEMPPLTLPPKLPPHEAAVAPKPPLPKKPDLPSPSFMPTPGRHSVRPSIPAKSTLIKHTGVPPLPKKPPTAPVFDLLDSTITSDAATTHKAIMTDLQRALNQMSEADTIYVRDNLRSRKLSIESALGQFDGMYESESKALKNVIESIVLTKKSLQQEIETVERQFEKIDFYEKENGEVLDSSMLASADSVATNQLYNLVAKDYALSDTMHMLARLLACDTITLDIFIKKTRHLGREQFFTRIHIQKVVESMQH